MQAHLSGLETESIQALLIRTCQYYYAPAPVVREAALKENPKIAEILKPIFASLDLATLQGLNARVQVGGEPAAAVAQDYLTQAGFLD